MQRFPVLALAWLLVSLPALAADPAVPAAAASAAASASAASAPRAADDDVMCINEDAVREYRRQKKRERRQAAWRA